MSTSDAGVLDDATTTLAHQVAGTFGQFIEALHTIGREGDLSAVPLLLLEISDVIAAGARLGAQLDFTPRSEYQPDVGPEADLDELRLQLSRLLDAADTYSFVFDPYNPEIVDSQVSDDLTSIATDLDNGLRHYRAGDIQEALWWWQFSFVNSWGNLAGAVLNALWSVVSHDRLDSDDDSDADQVTAADELLGGD